MLKQFKISLAQKFITQSGSNTHWVFALLIIGIHDALRHTICQGNSFQKTKSYNIKILA